MSRQRRTSPPPAAALPKNAASDSGPSRRQSVLSSSYSVPIGRVVDNRVRIGARPVKTSPPASPRRVPDSSEYSQPLERTAPESEEGWSLSASTPPLGTASPHRRAELALQASGLGVWDLNVRTHRIDFSERALELLGIGAFDDHHLQGLLGRIHPDDSSRVATRIAVATRSGSALELEFRIHVSENEVRHIRLTALGQRLAGSKTTNLVGTVQDVTERETARESLHQLTSRDGVTGLASRDSFLEGIRRIHRRSVNAEGFQAVLYIRLDRFDELTDGLGDEGANRLLVDVGQRLCAWFRGVSGTDPLDYVARLARQEFAIHLPSVRTGGELEQLAAKAQSVFTSPMRAGSHDVVVTANVGIASSLECAEPEEMFENARTAMRIARADKTSRVAYFSATRRGNAYDIVKLEADLRLAAWRGELSFNYQPLVQLSSGRLTGFEALMRWKHPECGWISPAKFIPLAEQSDLAIELGAWTIESVCEQIARWNKMGLPQDFSVNVNLSGPHLAEASLPETVEEILRDFRLTGDRLKVEITESAIADPDKTVGVLKELRALGMKICIDDFGTGYSSLSLLHRFPLDVLKIDKAFVTRLGEPDGNDAIARSILALAHSLNLTVVAEGIETAKVAEHLTSLGCEIGQGYLYSRPVTASFVETWFEESDAPTFDLETRRTESGALPVAPEESALPLASIRARR